MRFLFELGCLLLAATATQATTTCLHQQPRLQSSPSNATVSEALHGIISHTKNGICSDNFAVLPNGSQRLISHRSNGSLVLQVTRPNEKAKLDAHCVEAFTSIIHQCIGLGTFWGGNATVDGLKYAIYNDAYPRDWIPATSAVFPGPSPSIVKPVSSSPARPKIAFPGESPLTDTVNPWWVRITKSVHLRPPQSSKHPSPTPTRVPAAATSSAKSKHSAVYTTKTIPGVTGPPGSYSQTKTTDGNGHSTVLPLWFDTVGAAIIVVPLAAAAGAIPIPPPPGLPPVRIGPNGEASPASTPAESLPQRPNVTPTPSHSHSALTPSPSSMSTRRSISSRTRSSQTSSAVPSGQPAMHLIFPKDGQSTGLAQFTSELSQTFGQGLFTSSNRLSGVVYWSAVMTPDLAKTFEANPLVAGVEENEIFEVEPPLSEDPSTPQRRSSSKSRKANREAYQMEKSDADTSTLDSRNIPLFERETYAPDDLITVSVPPPWNAPPGNAPFGKEFVYDPLAGKGSTVYIVDSGSYFVHPDLLILGGAERWLWVFPHNGQQIKDDPNGHGTCLVDRVVGFKNGVAKNANIVIVKLPSTPSGAVQFDARCVLEALNLIAEDIYESHTLGKAVVNMSLGIDTQSGLRLDAPPAFVNCLKNIMEQMVSIDGVVFVVASGNSGRTPGRKNIDLYPAGFVAQIPIITVGATSAAGVTADFSQGGPLLSVSAPGFQVTCASHDSDGYRIVSGTSVAAPIVAGLAAYLMSLPKYQDQIYGGTIAHVPYNVRRLIQGLAYVRPGGTDRVIYNGWYDASNLDVEMCTALGLGKRAANCSSVLIQTATSKPPAPLSSIPPKSTSPPPPVAPAEPLPGEIVPGWGPNNPSACIGSPGCDAPGMRNLFQQAISRIDTSKLYTTKTAFSSNFIAQSYANPTSGALITLSCANSQAYVAANITGADIYNAVQMIRAWPCDTCGTHVMTNPSCSLLMDYCKPGDCVEINTGL